MKTSELQRELVLNFRERVSSYQKLCQQTVEVLEEQYKYLLLAYGLNAVICNGIPNPALVLKELKRFVQPNNGLSRYPIQQEHQKEEVLPSPSAEKKAETGRRKRKSKRAKSERSGKFSEARRQVESWLPTKYRASRRFTIKDVMADLYQDRPELKLEEKDVGLVLYHSKLVERTGRRRRSESGRKLIEYRMLAQM